MEHGEWGWRTVAPDKSVRTYVTAIVRVGASGSEVPLAVILPDGRTYEISKVTTTQKVGGSCERLTVTIGQRTTNIWRDTAGWGGTRWYVVMRDALNNPFAEAAREWAP